MLSPDPDPHRNKMLRLTLDFLSEIVFGLVFSRRGGQTLPPIRSPLILESAVTLASKIRQRFWIMFPSDLKDLFVT
jgi:hypothetical protein